MEADQPSSGWLRNLSGSIQSELSNEYYIVTLWKCMLRKYCDVYLLTVMTGLEHSLIEDSQPALNVNPLLISVYRYIHYISVTVYTSI